MKPIGKAQVIFTYECPECGETMRRTWNGGEIATCEFADCPLNGIEFEAPGDGSIPGEYMELKKKRRGTKAQS